VIDTAKFSLQLAMVFEIYPDAKGVPGSKDIFFVSSRHVECVVLIERK
jgi:hypothetical protein